MKKEGNRLKKIQDYSKQLNSEIEAFLKEEGIRVAKKKVVRFGTGGHVILSSDMVGKEVLIFKLPKDKP